MISCYEHCSFTAVLCPFISNAVFPSVPHGAVCERASARIDRRNTPAVVMLRVWQCRFMRRVSIKRSKTQWVHRHGNLSIRIITIVMYYTPLAPQGMDSVTPSPQPRESLNRFSGMSSSTLRNPPLSTLCKFPFRLPGQVRAAEWPHTTDVRRGASRRPGSLIDQCRPVRSGETTPTEESSP